MCSHDCLFICARVDWVGSAGSVGRYFTTDGGFGRVYRSCLSARVIDGRQSMIGGTLILRPFIRNTWPADLAILLFFFSHSAGGSLLVLVCASCPSPSPPAVPSPNEGADHTPQRGNELWPPSSPPVCCCLAYWPFPSPSPAPSVRSPPLELFLNPLTRRSSFQHRPQAAQADRTSGNFGNRNPPSFPDQ